MTQSIKSDRIAKLLATEDLSVRHSKTAKTASFDVIHRILTLPIYLIEDNDVHDMMTGHEVGHALWTDAIKLEKALMRDYNKDILNVVEDARIEKKIKKRYPGIVRNFIAGYRILEDKGFFYEDKSQINEMQFLDRLNLFFKLGLNSNVRFYAEEKELVEQVANCESWKDVLKATRAIMEFTAAQMQEELEQEELDAGFEQSEESGNVSEMTNEEVNDILDEEGFSSQTQERFDDMAEESTQEANMTEINRKYLHENAYGRLPKVNLDKIVIPYKRVIPEMAKALDEAFNSYDDSGFNMNRHGNFAEFRRKTSKIVNYMVKEFERKKAAAEYRKESIAKTGVLDVNKLFSYKYNDDVFLKNIIRPDGKNHGMVFLLDWSASMTGHLVPTIEQLLALVWFCKKVNVPFEVFAFTNSYQNDKMDDYLDYVGKFERKRGVCHMQNGDSFNLLHLFGTKMNAAELTKMSKLLYTFARLEYVITNRSHFGRRYSMGSTPLNEALVSTAELVPLFKNSYNLDIVNLFVLTDGDGNSQIHGVYEEDENKRAQQVVGENLIIEDKVTKKTHNTGELGRSLRNQGAFNYNNRWISLKGQEYAILNIIKETPGVNMVGIFVDGESPKGRYNKYVHNKFMPTRHWSDMKELHVKGRKEMKKVGFTSHNWMAYDGYYIIPAGGLYVNEAELQIESDMTASQMKRVFGKHQAGKLKSKVFVNRLMEIIC